MPKVYTESEVRELLAANTLVSRKPERCTSAVYSVFEVIYNADDKKIDWYICRVCSALKNICLRTHGTSQMSRHPCFVKSRQNAQPQEEQGKYVRAPSSEPTIEKKRKRNEPTNDKTKTQALSSVARK